MGNKRSREHGKHVPSSNDVPEAMDGDGSADDEDFNMVDVEFEWFNFDPDIDFHGVKSLLRQLLDVDASLFDMSALANLVLSQPTIGSTVKVDGKATDAYAMLTVLNTLEHRDEASMKPVLEYLVEKASSTDSLSAVAHLINAGSPIGLILSERLINVPSEIAPPMYSLLIDEVEAAVEDKEPYEFSHYLIVSKTYSEVESTLHAEHRKRKKAREESSTFYFHPEDEMLHKHASAYGTFSYTKEADAVADSKRAFQEMGIKTMGHMVLIEAGKFAAAVKSINEYLCPGH
ncbi:hypothetical protein CDD82_3796 [Ophiocordyceps australis]|uniref:Protein BCP1 n=1 Tax=Ophiocordyceps australis TaxID=1399860 RepID=A0A2C5Z9W5_9HYPO|nr:hypothetical protein CDD82_3796 [Ophiocordyceps australis]